VDALLLARGLSVDRGRRPVLRDVSLELRPGDGFALVGPNAAGKSTLVRALAGLLRPRSGEIRLRGRPLTEWSRSAIARVVAVVLPEDDSGIALTVADRVALGRYPHRGPFRSLDADDRSAIARALDATGIAPLAARRLDTLSAGERQLAGLARGLAQEPEILLLDEPAAHLDIGHQLGLFRVLDEVRARGVAVLAVVHDLQRAGAWASRMALLAGGSVAVEGTAEAVLSSPLAAAAFGVSIRGHRVPGLGHPLYSFGSPAGEEDAKD